MHGISHVNKVGLPVTLLAEAYIYIYMCVCVCVCIYIYIYICLNFQWQKAFLKNAGVMTTRTATLFLTFPSVSLIFSSSDVD